MLKTNRAGLTRLANSTMLWPSADDRPAVRTIRRAISDACSSATPSAKASLLSARTPPSVCSKVGEIDVSVIVAPLIQ